MAVITNEQGRTLVDTALAESSAAVRVEEIGGGCFCCQYPALEDGLLAAADAGATVALAEAVGSCTDLVATVLSPLAARRPGRLSVAPLSVLVDPWRAAEVRHGAFSDDVAYLFHKQIQEADVVVLTRADLPGAPDVESWLRELAGEAPVVRVSGVTGDGIGAWLATRPARLAAPLDIDYDRYAAAEAELGWANARVRVRARNGTPLRPRAIVERFFTAMGTQHLRRAAVGPLGDAPGPPPRRAPRGERHGPQRAPARGARGVRAHRHLPHPRSRPARLPRAADRRGLWRGRRRGRPLGARSAAAAAQAAPPDRRSRSGSGRAAARRRARHRRRAGGHRRGSHSGRGGDAIAPVVLAMERGVSVTELGAGVFAYPTLGRIVRRLTDERFLEAGVHPVVRKLFGRFGG